MLFKVERQSHGGKGDGNDRFNEPPCSEAVNISSGDWVVGINSLKHLVDFSKKYGMLVFDAKERKIEIYDDWRE